MDFISSGWGIAGAIVAFLVVVAIVRRNQVRKRAAQYRADESTIINIYNDMGYYDITTYKDLPNLKSRLSWLQRHYPDFISAAERHYKENELSLAVASNLDFRILQNAYSYGTRERALSFYESRSSLISLNEYQEQLNVAKAEQERLDAVEREAQARYRAERAAKEKAEKEAAKLYWDSLSSDEKEAFKKAKGKSDRQKAMVAPVSKGYSVETLYPLIMATEFSNVNSNYSDSIDYCQSPSYTSYDSGSSYSSDSGSSYSDSGSSYSDSGSSSCDGGGGGGGE